MLLEIVDPRLADVVCRPPRRDEGPHRLDFGLCQPQVRARDRLPEVGDPVVALLDGAVRAEDEAVSLRLDRPRLRRHPERFPEGRQILVGGAAVRVLEADLREPLFEAGAVAVGAVVEIAREFGVRPLRAVDLVAVDVGPEQPGVHRQAVGLDVDDIEEVPRPLVAFLVIRADEEVRAVELLEIDLDGHGIARGHLVVVAVEGAVDLRFDDVDLAGGKDRRGDRRGLDPVGRAVEIPERRLVFAGRDQDPFVRPRHLAVRVVGGEDLGEIVVGEIRRADDERFAVGVPEVVAEAELDRRRLLVVRADRRRLAPGHLEADALYVDRCRLPLPVDRRSRLLDERRVDIVPVGGGRVCEFYPEDDLSVIIQFGGDDSVRRPIDTTRIGVDVRHVARPRLERDLDLLVARGVRRLDGDGVCLRDAGEGHVVVDAYALDFAVLGRCDPAQPADGHKRNEEHANRDREVLTRLSAAAGLDCHYPTVPRRGISRRDRFRPPKRALYRFQDSTPAASPGGGAGANAAFRRSPCRTPSGPCRPHTAVSPSRRRRRAEARSVGPAGPGR